MFDLIDRVNHHTKALRDDADRMRVERDLAVSPAEAAAAVAATAPDGLEVAARPEPSTPSTVSCGDCPSEPARGTQAA